MALARFTLAQRVWARQFSRFVLVGLSGVVVDFAVYLALTRTFGFWQQHFVVASSLSSFLAATNNFFWNRRFTFPGTGQSLLSHYTRYLLVTLGYLGLIPAGLWLLVR